MKPYICGKEEVLVPECNDCGELETRVTNLEDEVDECCTEVKGTLNEHTTDINSLDNRVLILEQSSGGTSEFNTVVVSELPETGEPNTIYLVGSSGAVVGSAVVGQSTIGGSSNSYIMYMYVDNAWRQIGSGDIDLDNYVTTEDLQAAIANFVSQTDFDTALAGKQDTLTAYRGIRIDNNAIERVPLIGEVVEMASIVAPQYYGNYDMIDKNLADTFLENENVTWSSAATNRASAIRRIDKNVTIKLQFDAKITDDTLRICRISYATLGLRSAPNQYIVGYCDGTHQMGMFRAMTDGTDMIIDALDAVPHSGYSKDTWHLQFDVYFGLSDIDNNACDRFYFKRRS